MQTPVDIEAHREAVLRRWADSPRHSWLGVHVNAMRTRERKAAQSLKGRVLDADGEEVLLTMDRFGTGDILEQVTSPMLRQPFAGANRQAKRAAAAKARRRA